MAATHIPPPRSLCPTWSTNHTSGGGEVRWGNDTVRFATKRSNRLSPRDVSCKNARWRRTGICSARFNFWGNSAEQAKEEDASTLMEMANLVDDLLKLSESVNKRNRGIGADVRTRVEVLYNRATLLKYSADNMVAAGGRVPVQLTATLKGLQREHASVKNIARLVMEAGPIITDVQDLSSSKVRFFSAEAETRQSVGSDVVFMEQEETEASVFELLTRQSSLSLAATPPTTSRVEEYVMSTPAADDSSPCAAFRREIEHRVMEQLARQKPTADLGITSKEQEEGLGKPGDATSENNNVLEAISNFPLRGWLPRRREAGAVEDDEAEPAGSFSGEIDAPEAQAQMLQGTQDQSSSTEAQEQSEIVVGTESNLNELDKLRNELSALEQQLAEAKEGSARAERAEAQLRQLTEEMAAMVPLDVHEEVVKLERQSLIMARKKIAQITAEVREKEVILGAVKQEMTAENERLLEKVRRMSGELSKRVRVEEVEAAVNNAVHDLETELRKALQRAEAMKLELDTNENLLKQLQKEWDAERANLRGELANMRAQFTELQQDQTDDRTKILEAVEKVKELDGSIRRLRQSMVAAEEERINREKFVLATVRSLVADMVKVKRVQVKSDTAHASLLEATQAVDGNDQSEATDSEASQMSSAEDELESTLSDEKAVALETFFNIMADLIQQESEKLETINNQSRTATILQPGLRKLGSSKVDGNTKPIITLYYESSWEFAYLHYSADSSEWTELPGVCMRNEIVTNNMSLKVIDIEGNSMEFVLTDGRGAWDCAPVGGNYRIENSGTFLLSSGSIVQKQ